MTAVARQSPICSHLSCELNLLLFFMEPLTDELRLNSDRYLAGIFLKIN